MSRPELVVLTSLAVVAALALPASGLAQPPTQPKPERQCFDAGTVSGFSPVDERHINLQVGASRHFQLTLMGICRDVDWAQRLAISTRAGGSRICTGLDADIIVLDSAFPQRCPVTEIRRLTPEEVKATRARRR